MTVHMCMTTYHRKTRMKPFSAGSFADLFCHLPQGHDGDHSWQLVYDADTVELDPPRTAVPPITTEGTAYFASTVCGMLADGELDPYIEQILATGHNRKRALRSVRGFER